MSVRPMRRAKRVNARQIAEGSTPSARPDVHPGGRGRWRDCGAWSAGPGFGDSPAGPAARSLLVAAVALLGGTPVVAGEDPPRPNVVLILCDDMGWSDVGCYGGEVRTPHIDRLAAEGMRFTQFYNNAKCTTTRASIHTGAYPLRGGPHLRPGVTASIASVLREDGYRTALIGKWHLGAAAPRHPLDQGFDVFYGLLDGCCNFFDPARPDPKFKGGRVRVFADGRERITEFDEGFYTTDAFTDRAVRFIEGAEESEPFFLHLTYTAPHYPLHAWPEDIERYEGVYDAGWDALREERYARQLELGLVDPDWTLPARDPEAQAWEDAPHHDWQALRMEVYAAMIDRMDQGIGRVLDALERAGVAGDTLVLFLSDNGGCAELPGGEDPTRTPGPEEFYTTCGPGWAYASNTPFRRYKQWVHEGGIATPLVARWPGQVPAGSITHEVGHVIDFLPTFAELAGAEVPASVEGLSLAPVLAGGTREGHAELYWEWSRSRAIRRGDWKLAWDRKVKRWELYDLAKDRTETVDLADEHEELVLELATAWEAWAGRTGLDVR